MLRTACTTKRNISVSCFDDAVYGISSFVRRDAVGGKDGRENKRKGKDNAKGKIWIKVKSTQHALPLPAEPPGSLACCSELAYRERFHVRDLFHRCTRCHRYSTVLQRAVNGCFVSRGIIWNTLVCFIYFLRVHIKYGDVGTEVATIDIPL